jgi:hypothetical protein
MARSSNPGVRQVARCVGAAVIGAAGVFVGSAHALIIDSFSDDQLVQVTGAAPSNGSDSLNGGGILGGTRTIAVNKSAGGTGQSNAATAEVIGGLLSIANGPVTNSVVGVAWNGGGTDLTEGGAATGIFLSLPSPIDNDLTIAFSINGSSTVSQVFPNGSQGNAFFIPFTSFSNPGAAANANLISMTLSDGPAWDAQIDFVETRPATTPGPDPVPAPGTLALLGLGILTLGLGRSARA